MCADVVLFCRGHPAARESRAAGFFPMAGRPGPL